MLAFSRPEWYYVQYDLFLNIFEQHVLHSSVLEEVTIMKDQASEKSLLKQLDWFTMLVPFCCILVLCTWFVTKPEQSSQVLGSIRYFLDVYKRQASDHGYHDRRHCS